MSSRIHLMVRVLGVAIVVACIGSMAQAALLIHYDLNEGSGTSAADLSGLNHAGTFSADPTWSTTDMPGAPGVVGNVASVSVGGTVDLRTASVSNLNGLKSFTAMMWINGDPAGSGGNGAPRFLDNNATGIGYQVAFDPTGKDLYTSVSGTAGSQDGVINYAGKTTTGWHNWATTYNEGSISAYLDGQLLGTASITFTKTGLGGGLFKVANNSSDIRGLANGFDDFRFYGSQTDGSGALSQAEILNVIGVPEPSTVALAISGLIGLLAYAWRKRK